jgi:hypothetical protein
MDEPKLPRDPERFGDHRDSGFGYSRGSKNQRNTESLQYAAEYWRDSLVRLNDHLFRLWADANIMKRPESSGDFDVATHAEGLNTSMADTTLRSCEQRRSPQTGRGVSLGNQSNPTGWNRHNRESSSRTNQDFRPPPGKIPPDNGLSSSSRPRVYPTKPGESAKSTKPGTQAKPKDLRNRTTSESPATRFGRGRPITDFFEPKPIKRKNAPGQDLHDGKRRKTGS